MTKTNGRPVAYLRTLILLFVLFFPVGVNAQVNIAQHKEMDEKSKQNEITCITYEVQVWGSESRLIITPDSINFESYLKGKKKSEYVVKTTELLWRLLLDRFDLNTFKESKGGMTHQIFDGGDETFSIKTINKEYTFLNPSNDDDKMMIFLS